MENSNGQSQSVYFHFELESKSNSETCARMLVFRIKLNFRFALNSVLNINLRHFPLFFSPQKQDALDYWSDIHLIL